MGRKRHTPEQIIEKLREAVSDGRTVSQVCKKVGINEQTRYRWRNDYGGVRTDQAKRTAV
jgi:transposase-like protein